ncbi:hypothetical protein SMICM304S_01291 [Streptomyces microflavus]
MWESGWGSGWGSEWGSGWEYRRSHVCPVTSPLPPSKTMSEQEKKFSWLSDRTHWMNIKASPERPDGNARSQ